MEGEQFVHVYEEEFKEFYDNYFSKCKVDSEGYLSITDEIPVDYSAFIYWLYTTDNISGVVYSDSITRIKLHDNLISIVSKERLYRINVNFSNTYYLKEELGKIKMAFSASMQTTTPGYKFYPNYLLRCRETIKLTSNKIVEYTVDVMNKLFDLDVEPYSSYFEYKTYEGVVQSEIINTYISLLTLDDIKEINERIKNDSSYTFEQQKEFTFITKPLIATNVFQVMRERTALKFAAYVMPTGYYHKTIGYHLDILNGYCGHSKMMSGFHEWAKNVWEEENDNDEQLCQILRNKIISKYIY